VLEQRGARFLGSNDAPRLDLVAEEARGRQGAPVLDTGLAERAEDAAVGVEDPAVRVAERAGVAL
jgi:hypothetical protein